MTSIKITTRRLKLHIDAYMDNYMDAEQKYFLSDNRRLNDASFLNFLTFGKFFKPRIRTREEFPYIEMRKQYMHMCGLSDLYALCSNVGDCHTIVTLDENYFYLIGKL